MAMFLEEAVHVPDVDALREVVAGAWRRTARTINTHPEAQMPEDLSTMHVALLAHNICSLLGEMTTRGQVRVAVVGAVIVWRLVRENPALPPHIGDTMMTIMISLSGIEDPWRMLQLMNGQGWYPSKRRFRERELARVKAAILDATPEQAITVAMFMLMFTHGLIAGVDTWGPLYP